jgi:outer membrane receptor for ferrienterochelin and colicins
VQQTTKTSDSDIFIAVKKVPVFILFLLMWGVSVAQSAGVLQGQISAEGANLEFANAVLLKTSYSATSDSTGNFTIENIPSGKYQLRVSYVGYENYQTEVTIDNNKQTVVSISLIPLASKLKEVVVTGSLKEVQKIESVTPIDVYASKYFLKNPSSNIFESLNSVNGIFADIDNGVSNTVDVQINGLEGNYTMFLIDGVPALNGMSGLYALSSFPMSVIDKVEIVKGASSTLYGSEAIAGVINIKTKNPASTPKFSANVSLSSYADVNSDFSVSYKAGKANSLFSFSTENMNTRWDIDKDGFTDIPLVNRVHVFNKWSVPLRQGKATSFYARYLFDDRFGGEKDMPSKWRGSNRNYGESVTTNQWQAGVQTQLPIKENIQILIDNSGHLQNGFYGFNSYKGTLVSGFTQVKWDKKLDKVNEILMGASYRIQYFSDNSPLSSEELTGYKNVSHLPGIFLEDEITIHPQHKLTAGLRFDYSTRSGPAFTPRLNYKWNSKSNNDILRIAAGIGYRVPNVFNEGIAAMNGSRSILIAEKLKPETAVNANVSYNRIQKVKGGLINIECSAFYTYFFNFVNPDYGDDPELIVYENSKGATAYGFSANADFTFNFPLKLGVGFTYARVFELEKNDEGEIVKEYTLHQPNLMGNFYLSYNFPAPGISIDWTGNLVSPMLLSAVPNDERPASSRWFSLQNIQFTKRFNKGVELYLGIKNIFNFMQKNPILRPFDPFNRFTNIDNPNGYTFDTTYGFTATKGISGFAGFRYVLQ